jgi:hypothetical protein
VVFSLRQPSAYLLFTLLQVVARVHMLHASSIRPTAFAFTYLGAGFQDYQSSGPLSGSRPRDLSRLSHRSLNAHCSCWAPDGMVVIDAQVRTYRIPGRIRSQATHRLAAPTHRRWSGFWPRTRGFCRDRKRRVRSYAHSNTIARSVCYRGLVRVRLAPSLCPEALAAQSTPLTFGNNTPVASLNFCIFSRAPCPSSERLLAHLSGAADHLINLALMRCFTIICREGGPSLDRSFAFWS